MRTQTSFPESHRVCFVVVAFCERCLLWFDEQKVYFRVGYNNLKTIMKDLLDNHGMNRATEDQMGEMLPNSVTRQSLAVVCS